jgi:hypothetical protein
MGIVERYNSITKLPMQFDSIDIVTYIPKPTVLDYKRGYIVRFFVQKANDDDAPIFEIKKEYVSTYTNNPFYRIAILDWRITGERSDIKKSNSASVALGCKQIPSIYLYLPNLLQFCK